MKQIAFRSFFLFSFLVFFSLILGMETAFSTPSLYSAIRIVDDPGQSPALPEPSTQKRAAIVIDDFGNKMGGTEDMLALPFPITVAVMPFLQTTKADAEAAHAAGKEVIIHLPMEPKIARKSWLGPGVISTDLKNDEIRKRVHAAIDEVPHAIGINNHMGSKATGDERVMKLVLEVCKERGLFFLDSHTNYWSIACRKAKEVGVPCIENHLFLDDIHTKKHISQQVRLLDKHLKEHSTCVTIGHVGRYGSLTAAVLREQIPALTEKSGIRIVRISELVPKPK